MFLLLDIENMQNPSGFIRLFEIANFLDFRKVYKKHWILTLLENTISTKSENAYKTTVFLKIVVIPMAPSNQFVVLPLASSNSFYNFVSARTFTEVHNDNFDPKRHRGTQR